ncbi:hypothetical protein [Legionella sp. WA2024007413]
MHRIIYQSTQFIIIKSRVDALFKFKMSHFQMAVGPLYVLDIKASILFIIDLIEQCTSVLSFRK